MVEANENKVEWLAALRAGDTSACESLQAFIRDRVLPSLRLASGVSRDEVLADTVSTVWLSIRKLRDDSKLFPFIATIARRIASRKRREGRKFQPLPREEKLPQGHPVGLGNIEREEILDRLSTALRRNEQKLFRLVYVLGASNPEVQDKLKISSGMLRKRKHRMNLRLRRAAEDEPGESKRD